MWQLCMHSQCCKSLIHVMENIDFSFMIILLKSSAPEKVSIDDGTFMQYLLQATGRDSKMLCCSGNTVEAVFVVGFDCAVRICNIV